MTKQLEALARRVAALNPNAGEIGAGMLASLVQDAREALAEVSGWRAVCINGKWIAKRGHENARDMRGVLRVFVDEAGCNEYIRGLA